MRAAAAVVAVLAVGCVAANQGDDGDDGPGTTVDGLGRVIRWPTMSADCDAPWTGRIDVLNGSVDAGDFGLGVNNYDDGAVYPDPSLHLMFPVTGRGRALIVDREAAGGDPIRLLVFQGSKQFDNGLPHDGQTSGQLVPRVFDVPSGTVAIDFVGVSLIGEDPVNGGTHVCKIDGTLEAELGRRAIGEPCREDLECGGPYSNRICEPQTLSCQSGSP